LLCPLTRAGSCNAEYEDGTVTHCRTEDLIDGLIEKVLATYPAERIERIKLRTSAVWNGQPLPDRIVYIAGEAGEIRGYRIFRPRRTRISGI